jgi:hypothetical protein
VSYTGQAFRQVLINNLKSVMAGLERDGGYNGTAEQLVAALDSYYSYQYDSEITAPLAINGASNYDMTVTDLDGNELEITEGPTFEDLQTEGKQLRNKTAGNDNELRHGSLKGWSTTSFLDQDLTQIDADGAADGVVEPEDLIVAWFRVVAEQAVNGQAFNVANPGHETQVVQEAYILENGWDVSQLVQKFLHGAVSFSQAAGDYLSTDLAETKGLNADNTEVAEAGANFTALEHHWDEAFGYFGAARDFSQYTDEQVKAGGSRDTNEDGSISLRSEKNQGIAVNTAKRDLGASTGDVDFSSTTFEAFVKGRYLLTTRPEGYLAIAKAYAVVAIANWEKTIAATVIHYINETITEMQEYGSADYSFKQHAKVWSEMKGYGLALQFNPLQFMSLEKFEEFHELVGDKPVLGEAGDEAIAAYISKLEQARTLLAQTYGFAEANTLNW